MTNSLERLAEDWLQLDGYLTLTRVPVPLRGREYNTDLDVVGFHPHKREVVIIECKGTGATEEYPEYSGRYADQNRLSECVHRAAHNWELFVDSPRNIWDFRKRFLKVIVAVFPGSWDGPGRSQFQSKLSRKVRLPVLLLPVHELLLDLSARVKVDFKRRRTMYDSPSLELLRWVHRRPGLYEGISNPPRRINVRRPSGARKSRGRSGVE